MSSMPPVPVMVLRIVVFLPLSRISAAGSASRQLRPRGLERLARDVFRRARPGRRIRRLVAHEPPIALAVQEREDLLEGHAAAARRPRPGGGRSGAWPGSGPVRGTSLYWTYAISPSVTSSMAGRVAPLRCR